MQIKNVRLYLRSVASLVALFAMLAIPTFAAAKAANENKTRPTVAIIKADWCSACRKLEPTMMELMEQYGNRLNFVVLDVSTDEKVAESEAAAKKLGLKRFFDENKKKTSTVAIFVRGSKPVFHTMANFDRQAYVKAFDDAIAKAGK